MTFPYDLVIQFERQELLYPMPAFSILDSTGVDCILLNGCTITRLHSHPLDCVCNATSRLEG